MESTTGRDRVFKLGQRKNVIGRSYRCDIRIPLPRVALQHCIVEVNDHQAVTLTPFRPELVVMVNDLPIDGTRRIFPGDVIQIGPVCFRFDHVSMISDHVEPKPVRFAAPIVDHMQSRPRAVSSGARTPMTGNSTPEPMKPENDHPA